MYRDFRKRWPRRPWRVELVVKMPRGVPAFARTWTEAGAERVGRRRAAAALEAGGYQ